MHNTTQLYKDQVNKLPQRYVMNLNCIIGGGSDFIYLETENNEPLTTEEDEVLEFPAAAPVEVLPNDIFESGYSENMFINAFSIGTAVKPTMWVRIFNKEGKFRNELLSTAEYKPTFSLLDDEDNTTDIVPIGVFYAEKLIVQDTDIRIELCDKMAFTEKLFNPQGVPRSLYDIATGIALDVFATVVTTPGDLSVLSLVVNDDIFTGYSKKQVLECIAQVCGSFVRFNREGNLEFKWFSETSVELNGDTAKVPLELNGNTFYLDDNSLQITGVKIVFEDTELCSVGTDDYLLTISENPITETHSAEIAEFILNRLSTTKYIPCRYDRIGGDPSLQVGDILTVIDNKEKFDPDKYDSYDKYPLYITSFSWHYNCGGFSDTYIASGNTGDMNTDKGMNQAKKTAQLAKKIKEAKKDVLDELDSREKFLLAFNQTIAGSMGYYMTEVPEETGGVVRYMHDKPNLEESMVIYTQTVEGFAWTTDGWNNGEPLWKYGFDKNGNAILNTIYAYTITADVISSGLLKAKNGQTYFDLDKAQLVTKGPFGATVISDGDINFENEKGELAARIMQYGGGGGIDIILKKTDNDEQSFCVSYFDESELGAVVAFGVNNNGDCFVRNDLNVSGNICSFKDITAVNNIYSQGVLVSSTEKVKENISEVADVLNLFKQSKIYNYNYIKNGSNRKSHGFVIERETPEEVVAADGKHVDVYSMSALTWRGVQELLNRIEDLENKIESIGGKQ